MKFENFSIEIDGDGVALLTFDVPNRTMNTVTVKVLEELPLVTQWLKTNDAVKGVVLVSGKANGFCAGGDLGEISRDELTAGSAAPADNLLRNKFESLHGASRVFRDLELLGKPLAAAIDGMALGGGLEILLCCRYRVVADNPKIVLGLPESTLGLLPGGGGTQRLPRIIGIAAAFKLISEGRPFGPGEAKELGIVQELVPPGETVAAAKAWVRTKGDASQPWDKAGFRLPGGGPYDGGGPALLLANGIIRQKFHGNYPAQLNILKCIYEGSQVPIDAALRIESRYMLLTMDSPQAKAMVRSMFLSAQELGKAPARPKHVAKTEFRKVAILGDGALATAIACLQLKAGLETVLLGYDDATLQARKQAVAGCLAAAGLAPGKLDQYLSHIVTQSAGPVGADMIIAVGADARTLQRAQQVFGAACYVVAGSVFEPRPNLRETVMLGFAPDPERAGFIEIGIPPGAGDGDSAKIFDYARKFRKTPIVATGYIARITRAYIAEGVRMLAEGIAPAIIENAGRMASMARGPLALADEIGISLLSDLHPALRRLAENGRTGRQAGAGFYEYETQPQRLWPELATFFPVKSPRLPLAEVETLKFRLLGRQSLEAVRCMEEGLITDRRAADVGAILGAGAASWTGGPLSFIDMHGVTGFIELCRNFGADFTPPALLREMAANGGSFYEAPLG